MAPSILRKKEKAQKATKRNVSFAAGASENDDRFADPSDDTRVLHDGVGGGGDEEDAFDPIMKGEEDKCKINERQIRNAKSSRATSRAAALSSSKTFDDANDCGAAKYSDRGERLSGEEEVDKHFSLVHDYDDGQDEMSDKVQCPVEPFNLTSEREDGGGYFDGDTYVFRKNQNEGEEDAWLDNLKSDDGEGGPKTASEKKYIPQDGYIVKSQKKNEPRFNSNNLDETMTKEQIYEQYIPLLATHTETVMQALGRYGTIIKMEKKQKNNRDKRNAKNERASTPKKARNTASHTALDRLTELSNFCMMHFADGGSIYERSKEYFIKCSGNNNIECAKRKQPSYFTNKDSSAGEQHQTPKRAKASTDIGCKVDAKIDSGKVLQWEYKGNQDNAIHGPYSTQQMVDWISAGYFLGDMAVDVRPMSNINKIVVNTTGSEDSAQATKQDVVNDLLGDLDDDDEEEDNLKENAKEWMRSNVVNFSSYLQ